MELALPVQAVVDRSIILDVYLVSTLLHDKTTGEPVILRAPVGGPFGPLPGDPATFTASARSRTRRS